MKFLKMIAVACLFAMASIGANAETQVVGSLGYSNVDVEYRIPGTNLGGTFSLGSMGVSATVRHFGERFYGRFACGYATSVSPSVIRGDIDGVGVSASVGVRLGDFTPFVSVHGSQAEVDERTYRNGSFGLGTWYDVGNKFRLAASVNGLSKDDPFWIRRRRARRAASCVGSWLRLHPGPRGGGRQCWNRVPVLAAVAQPSEKSLIVRWGFSTSLLRRKSMKRMKAAICVIAGIGVGRMHHLEHPARQGQDGFGSRLHHLRTSSGVSGKRQQRSSHRVFGSPAQRGDRRSDQHPRFRRGQETDRTVYEPQGVTPSPKRRRTEMRFLKLIIACGATVLITGCAAHKDWGRDARRNLPWARSRSRSRVSRPRASPFGKRGANPPSPC